MANVSLVVVSHSKKIGDGLVDLLKQLTSDGLHIVSASGLEDELGTNPTEVVKALESCPDTSDIVIFCDLGSSFLSSDTAIDLVSDAISSRTTIVDAPFIEGAVAAAIEACIGHGKDEVIKRAEQTRGMHKR